jgi:hypothetical protein
MGRIHQSRRRIWKMAWKHRRALPYGGSASGYPLSKQSLSSSAEIRAEQRFNGYPPAQLAAYLARQPPITDVSGGGQVGSGSAGVPGHDVASVSAPEAQPLSGDPDESYGAQ